MATRSSTTALQATLLRLAIDFASFMRLISCPVKVYVSFKFMACHAFVSPADVPTGQVLFAAQRHTHLLPDGKRAGFFIGDGAGVGKVLLLYCSVCWHSGRVVLNNFPARILLNINRPINGCSCMWWIARSQRGRVFPALYTSCSSCR